MINPAGQECPLFYGDYYRGRSNEECRLLGPANLQWHPSLCTNCPMPKISASNACENMRFVPKIDRGFLRKTQIKLDVHCVKCQCNVEQPKIGCGQCHILPDVFLVSPDNPD